MIIRRLLLLSTVVGSALSVETGDECCVTGTDFLSDGGFFGQWRVSGEQGCSIGDNNKCYCSPILGDSDPLGPWIWQCNEDANGALQEPPVPFGPTADKICPDTIPVPVGFDPNAEGNDGRNPECTTDNPTGQVGDPPCSYDTCSDGGDLTAVCGCVDTTFGVGPVGEGDLQWFCLHSTCDCPSSSTEPGCPSDDNSASFKAAWSGLTMIFGFVAWLLWN